MSPNAASAQGVTLRHIGMVSKCLLGQQRPREGLNRLRVDENCGCYGLWGDSSPAEQP